MKYKAYLVEENEGTFQGSIKEIEMQSIEPGNLIIKVHYSSLNYKDALAASGVKGVASSYPFVPGIDVAGEVIESSSDIFKVGDKVIATGYKIGMKVFGGFGELVQLPAEWVVPLPENLSLKDAMSFGTAGLTAGACVKKIINAGMPKNMPVIVSGSTGGVGSVAVNLLSKLDYDVHAITGKPEEKDTRICMVTPHVQKRSNTSQRSSPGEKPKNNARPPIIVLDDEKEPIHDLVDPQVRSPTVQMSGVPGLNPSHLSFPRNCSNNI